MEYTIITKHIWHCRLDKRKFFVNGIFIFSGLTGCLYPLSVIKTRMMALDDAHRGVQGVYFTARDVVRESGMRGLYKGFGTVIGGLIPGRMVYLGVLEGTKKVVSTALQEYDTEGGQLSEAFVASTSSFVAGGMASLSGQLVAVPVDVISQRQMITGNVRISGIEMARRIIRQDGIRGLYRGMGASIMTFVPASAVWWSAYGAWQSEVWTFLDYYRGVEHHRGPTLRSERDILSVQVVSGVLTGWTTALITNPLDVIKTRIQTRDSAAEERLGWIGTGKQVFKNDGIQGFYRGVVPRMASASIWGTAMVTTYEFLKRMCALPDDQVA